MASTERKRRWPVTAAAPAAYALIFLISMGLGASLYGTRRTGPAATPPLTASVHEAVLERPDTFWTRRGFVLMEPPVRPPTSEDGRHRIVVYLKLPEGSAVRTFRREGESRVTLEYPVGSAADRVEYLGAGPVDGPPGPDWRVADVRGTEITSDGERFHVYRATTAEPTGDLLGLVWPRNDDRAQEGATSALSRLVQDGRVVGPRSPLARERLAGELRELNGCASCHVHGRPARRMTSDPQMPNEETDASGFFRVSTILSDRAPIETHRPRNANRGDRFVRFVCGAGEAGEVEATVDGSRSRDVSCPGAEVPVGWLDVRAARAASDARALRLCEARRFLYGHLDSEGRDYWREAMAECED